MEQDLSLYKIFHMVANTHSISKAAKELYVSQPAISKSIKKLEDNLNTRLFLRSSKGVRLTDEGFILYEHTKRAFEELSIGEKSIQHINELGIGHLKIGVSTTLCKYVLLSYLQDFITKYPHIKVTIKCQSTYQTLELLEQNKIDIGLIGKPNSLKNLDFYKVGEIQDTFVATRSYLEHLQVRENASSEEVEDTMKSNEIFKTCNLMLLDEKNITRLYVDDYFKENQIETNQVLEVTSMDLLIEFAKISLGVACVIKEFVTPELNSHIFIEIPLEKPLKRRDIGFVFQTNIQQTNAVNKFIEFYR